MPIFNPFDVIAVPFPYTDRPVRQRRPAVVVSTTSLTKQHQLLWVMMITAAENLAWEGDVHIDDQELAGLPLPSVIRPAKIATIEASEAELKGKITPVVRRAVLAAAKKYFAG